MKQRKNPNILEWTRIAECDKIETSLGRILCVFLKYFRSTNILVHHQKSLAPHHCPHPPLKNSHFYMTINHLLRIWNKRLVESYICGLKGFQRKTQRNLTKEGLNFLIFRNPQVRNFLGSVYWKRCRNNHLINQFEQFFLGHFFYTL